MKYPRTYHLPYSPGATKDDKKRSVKNGINWFSYYKGKEIVITEKLDGENTCFTRQDVYARSHGAPTRSPWSRNLWDPYDGLYWKVQSKIGTYESIFGENLQYIMINYRVIGLCLHAIGKIVIIGVVGMMSN